MDRSNEDFESTYEEEGIASTVTRNFQTKPFVMASMIGFAGACGFGYWRYKTKGYLVSPSLFIMQLRVAAQAVAVGCLTIGMLTNLVNQHVLKKKNDDHH